MRRRRRRPQAVRRSSYGPQPHPRVIALGLLWLGLLLLLPAPGAGRLPGVVVEALSVAPLFAPVTSRVSDLYELAGGKNRQ